MVLGGVRFPSWALWYVTGTILKNKEDYMFGGLGKALNSLASRQVARATSRLLAKEDCRVSDTFGGTKHAPKQIWIEKADVVDLIPSQLAMESAEVIHDLFGEMNEVLKGAYISFEPTDITLIRANGEEYHIAIQD